MIGENWKIKHNDGSCENIHIVENIKDGFKALSIKNNKIICGIPSAISKDVEFIERITGYV